MFYILCEKRRLSMNRLKELREKRGISARKLAEQVGFSQTKICKIERGEQKMSTPQAMALADYFGVSTDYLLGASAEEIFDKFIDTYKRNFREFNVDASGRVYGGYPSLSPEMSLKVGILDKLQDLSDVKNLAAVYELVSSLSDKEFSESNK